MLEEMRPHFCCLYLDSDYDYVWDVKVRHEDDHKVLVFLSGPISYQTAGEAIEAAYKNWKNAHATS